ncbi:hypothetical protein GWI33_015557 [Rhynchophorus ferrugineus]|uniref:Uncharacterized protein n=1 Tax=Rhynchophorus ferrugineus TaxID=354439 RepID=A0A834M4C9_RHYFE|nr:hypothetical protein GWI33_015557 [Rhynchophorus ferrugineus]
MIVKTDQAGSGVPRGVESISQGSVPLKQNEEKSHEKQDGGKKSVPAIVTASCSKLHGPRSQESAGGRRGRRRGHSSRQTTIVVT